MPLPVILLLAILPHLPPSIVATPSGLLVAGDRDCIPLPPIYFAWETPNGNSTLTARRQNGCLVLDWKLDRRGPSWLHLRYVQNCRGPVALVGWVEWPETRDERTVNAECYSDWADLLKHAKGSPLANDLMLVLRRSGTDAPWPP